MNYDQRLGSDQEALVYIFAVTTLVVLTCLCIWLGSLVLYAAIYVPRPDPPAPSTKDGDVAGDGKSDVDLSGSLKKKPDTFTSNMTADHTSITTYVPQMASQYFPFPLLAYNTHHFDERLLGWRDELKKYDWYDITTDAWNLLHKFGRRDDDVFSRIQYYELPGQEEKKEESPDGEQGSNEA